MMRMSCLASWWRCSRPAYWGHRALPGDRQREHERVQAWVVEPFSDEPTGGEEDPRFVGREHRICGASRPDAKPAVQDGKTIGLLGDQGRERVEVFATLGEDERVATLAQFAERVKGDPSRALLVAGDGAENLLDAGLRR